MDYELLLRFAIKGAKLTYLNTVLTNMRKGGTGDINWLEKL